MQRIDNATAAAALPTPAAAGTPGYFTGGNPAGGIPATILDQDWANMVQEELMSVLAAAGIMASKTDRTQLSASISKIIKNNSKALFNVQSVLNSTRTTVSGSGVGIFTTVISGSVVKNSATSNIMLLLTHPAFYGGSIGPGQIKLTVGGQSIINVLAPSTSGQGNGQTALNALFSGLGSGVQSWSIAYARSDATAWTATGNPTTTDASFLPVTTTTTLICGEIEP